MDTKIITDKNLKSEGQLTCPSCKYQPPYYFEITTTLVDKNNKMLDDPSFFPHQAIEWKCGQCLKSAYLEKSENKHEK